MKHEETMTWEADHPEWAESRSIELTYKIRAGSAEYIPPGDRPDLYDPGSAHEVELISATDVESSEILTLDDDLICAALSYITENHDFSEEPWSPFEDDR